MKQRLKYVLRQSGELAGLKDTHFNSLASAWRKSNIKLKASIFVNTPHVTSIIMHDKC